MGNKCLERKDPEVSKTEGRVAQTRNVVIGGPITDDSTNEWLALDQKDVRYLVEDIQELKPTIFCGVPRVYDRINDKISSGGAFKMRLFQCAYIWQYWRMAAQWCNENRRQEKEHFQVVSRGVCCC